MNCVHCQTTAECRQLWDGRYHCDACLRQIFRTIDATNIKSLLSSVFEEQVESTSAFNTSLNIVCVFWGLVLALAVLATGDLLVVGFLLSALLLVVGLIIYWNSNRPRTKYSESVVIKNGIVFYTHSSGKQGSQLLSECTWYIGRSPLPQAPIYHSMDRGTKAPFINIWAPDQGIIPCGFSNKSFIELCCILTTSDVGKKHDDTWWYGAIYAPLMILATMLGYAAIGSGLAVALSFLDKRAAGNAMIGNAVVFGVAISLMGFVVGVSIASFRRCYCHLRRELLVRFFFGQIAGMLAVLGQLFMIITNWPLVIFCCACLAAIGTLLLAIFGKSRSELPDSVHEKSLFIEALVSKYVKERM